MTVYISKDDDACDACFEISWPMAVIRVSSGISCTVDSSGQLLNFSVIFMMGEDKKEEGSQKKKRGRIRFLFTYNYTFPSLLYETCL